MPGRRGRSPQGGRSSTEGERPRCGKRRPRSPAPLQPDEVALKALPDLLLELYSRHESALWNSACGAGAGLCLNQSCPAATVDHIEFMFCIAGQIQAADLKCQSRGLLEIAPRQIA